MNKKLRLDNLLKTICLFLIYFIYNPIINYIFNFKNEIITYFIGDLLFLILTIFLYYKDIKKAISKLKKYKTINIVKKIFFSILTILIFTILSGIIFNIINPDISNYSNNEALISLYNSSKIYAVFKIFIFTTITESILFTLTIDKCCKSDVLFILLSSVIYTLSNFIFIGFNDKYILIQILTVFLQALLFSYIYKKNKSNIVIYMLIKFFYNIIPFIIVIMGLTV